MDLEVELEIVAGVATLFLKRPEKRNALTRELIEAVTATVESVAQRTGKPVGDPHGIRVLQIAAEGTVFCAGMDLDEMRQRVAQEDREDQLQRDSDAYCEMLAAIGSLSIPTVALVQGPVLAGGMGIVLACDMVVASDNAFFALPEPMRGIAAAMVAPLLILRIGAGPATAMLLSGERVSAESAFRLGLVHRLVQGSSLAEASQQITTNIMSGAPSALAMTKRHVASLTSGELCGLDLVEQVRRSASVSAEARQTDDAKEGLAAFLEKRQPNWMP